MLEPDAGKLARPVLRGGSGDNAAPLPDSLARTSPDGVRVKSGGFPSAVEMPFMRTLTSWDSLQPLVGTTSESGDLDFKATLDPSKGKIEFAKDVAALANVLGGHVLVGVSTDMGGTRCTGFHGIEKDLATEVTKVIEEQVKDRCRPTPILNVRSFSLPVSPKVVVVVAVDASPLAPVGVCLRQDKGGLLVDKGWAFPYRVGSLTEYLHPDQFGVYESMSARRA